MRIVADDAIPYLDEAFAAFGEIVRRPGAAIGPDVLADADVLLTRSITRVDAALLQGTRVRFVGSATAGTDHVAEDDLRALGITFAHAPGCNARAVVEYVLTAIELAAGGHDATWQRRGPVGVVGFGHVGRRLTRRLRALGGSVLVCDPPLEQALALGRAPAGPEDWTALAEHETFVDLDHVLEQCPIVTLHVPLSRSGPHATHHLVGARALAELPRDALVLNTCRGAVVDNAALDDWLARGHGRAVLDVWEHEPKLRASLLDHAGLVLATPHVAGYTLEGKVAATRMVHEALARFSQRPIRFDGREILDADGRETLPPSPSLAAALLAAHPLDRTDADLRALRSLPEAERATAFERLRKTYVFRRELSHFRLPAQGLPPEVADALVTLGVQRS